MSNQDEISKLRSKINDLESVLGYLQRDMESQNEMIIVDESRIKKLEQAVSRINSKLDGLAANSQTPRTLEDDVPPHY